MGCGKVEICKCLEFEEPDKLEYLDLKSSTGENLQSVCELLADYIIDKYENQIIYKIVFKNMEFFSKNEKREIFALVLKRLNDNCEERSYRRSLIQEQLRQYFQEEKTIVINGFVMFRLGFYFVYLENFILQEIDQYLVQKDYDEFLDLIKYFIDISSAKRETVEIYFDGNSYRIFDENKSDITNLFIEDLVDTCCNQKEQTENQVTPDDILLSSLISIAPRNIIFHNAGQLKNQELIQTINKVFCNRVQYFDI